MRRKKSSIIELCRNCNTEIKPAHGTTTQWRHVEPKTGFGGTFIFLCIPDGLHPEIFATPYDSLAKLIIRAEKRNDADRAM